MEQEEYTDQEEYTGPIPFICGGCKHKRDSAQDGLLFLHLDGRPHTPCCRNCATHFDHVERNRLLYYAAITGDPTVVAGVAIWGSGLTPEQALRDVYWPVEGLEIIPCTAEVDFAHGMSGHYEFDVIVQNGVLEFRPDADDADDAAEADDVQGEPAYPPTNVDVLIQGFAASLQANQFWDAYCIWRCYVRSWDTTDEGVERFRVLGLTYGVMAVRRHLSHESNMVDAFYAGLTNDFPDDGHIAFALHFLGRLLPSPPDDIADKPRAVALARKELGFDVEPVE